MICVACLAITQTGREAVTVFQGDALCRQHLTDALDLWRHGMDVRMSWR